MVYIVSTTYCVYMYVNIFVNIALCIYMHNRDLYIGPGPVDQCCFSFVEIKYVLN